MGGQHHQGQQHDTQQPRAEHETGHHGQEHQAHHQHGHEQHGHEQHQSNEHASGQQAQDPHHAEFRAPDNKEPEKSVPEQPTAPAPHPTQEVSAGPTKEEQKSEEQQKRQDENSEIAADNAEGLHHSVEEIEKDKGKDKPKDAVESEPINGDASFGAPAFPDAERSADLSQKLESPEGKEQQSAPVKGDVEPPQEVPAAQTQEIKGSAEFGNQGIPDPERSSNAAMQPQEPQGQGQGQDQAARAGPAASSKTSHLHRTMHRVRTSPQGQDHAQGENQAPGEVHEVSAKGQAEFGGQQTDTTVHEREAQGEADFGAHNYPNPEHETEMAGAMSGKHGAEQTSQAYSVSGDGQPHEMPPTEHPASEMATARQPDQPPKDDGHDH